jgi:M6 family metalloprotease-like protein
MKIRSRGAALLAFALVLSLIPFSANSNSHGAGPQGPPCGIYKVKKNEVIAGVNFSKGSYQINAFGISCSKVLGKKGLFAKFLKLKDEDPLPKPWKYLSEAVGAPKFSSGPGVGFRVQLISQGIPTPTPSPTPSPTVLSSPLTFCQIKEDNVFRKLDGLVISGFPDKQTYLPKTGTINVAMIPIDWADLPGESDWYARVQDQISLFDEYWKVVSGNKLKFKWTIQSNWIRLPGASRDYSVPYSEAHPETERLFEKVVPAVEAKFDFSGIDIVHFIAPKNQEILPEGTQAFPWSMINHPLKNVKAMTLVGKFFDKETMGERRTYWSYWAHETGHFLQLAHLGNPRGSFPMQGLDIMGMQDGPSRTLSGWWRFLSSWLEPEQILCLPKERVTDIEVSLRPLDNEGDGIKLIVIPLSDSEALLVESRRQGKFDMKGASNYQNGVLVYKYNAKLGHLQDFLIPFSPSSSIEDEEAWTGRIRYVLRQKDFVSEGGIEVELKSSTGSIDKVTLRPSGSVVRPTPKPQPSPTTSDFGRVPEMSGGITRLSEFTGQAEYWGRFFNSYRIYVTKKSDPTSNPIFDTGYVNEYRFPVRVTLTNLSCSRDLFAVVRFYSGLNGTGQVFSEPGQENQLSAVELRDGKCYGGYDNNGN